MSVLGLTGLIVLVTAEPEKLVESNPVILRRSNFKIVMVIKTSKPKTVYNYSIVFTTIKEKVPTIV